MSVFLVALSLFAGIFGLFAARALVGWPDRYQKWVWIGAFAPPIIFEFLHIRHPLVYQVIDPICAGVVVAEFLRPKIEQMKAKWVAKYVTPPPKKSSSSSKRSKPAMPKKTSED